MSEEMTVPRLDAQTPQMPPALVRARGNVASWPGPPQVAEPIGLLGGLDQSPT
jgi:hypothetical protein